MEYCGPRGIPHSMFLGRETGPQWTDDDREKALWWLIHDREKCPNCGTRPDEFDPEEGGDPHAYEWHSSHCRGCEIRAQGDDWLARGQKQGELRRGTSIRIRPIRKDKEKS
jgi:hypothetical protein